MAQKKDDLMEKIVSLAKRRGFIWQGSDVYGGARGTWDYGPLGINLRRNIENEWWNYFVEERDDIYGIDAAILMNPKVWQASGHVATFTDPMVEDLKTGERYRADHLLKDSGIEADALTNEELTAKIRENNIKSPNGNELSEVRNFNMMFQTNVGAVVNENSKAYLRPETAQGIFTNYKNVLDTFYPDLPFGLAQIGKSFRNEISPRDFIFRSREFGQMEIEYFVKPLEWQEHFDKLHKAVYDFLDTRMHLPMDMVHDYEVPDNDRAHYSERTIDIEFDFPIGQDELISFAYRTDYDLSNIQRASGKNMEYVVKGTINKFIPHVIEPSFGVERMVMAVMSAAYKEVEEDGKIRTYMAFPENLAPVKMIVAPLLKNKPALVEKAKEIYNDLRKKYSNVVYDDSGKIGKVYAKADEIGVPKVVVIDFDTIEKDQLVSVRNRDDASQIRVKPEDL